MPVSGADVVNKIRSQLGKPYDFGAGVPSSGTPSAFDCSSLMMWGYRQFGISIPRVTFEQVRIGSEVARNAMQPGDLIFMNWGEGPHSHVGIFAGDGKMIHAPQPGENVKEVSLNSTYWAHVDGIRRMPGVTGGPATSLPGDVLGRAADAAKGIAGKFTDPISGAIDGIRQELAGIAGAVATTGKLAELVTHFWLPTTLVRASAGMAGAGCVVVGVWFLSMEVRQ